jgi:hypothetical protein
MANSVWGKKGTNRWNSGKRTYPDIPTPGTEMPEWKPNANRFQKIHITPRKRPLGRVDITDLDPNIDYRRIMPLPYACACGNQMLLYTDFCSRCGRPTPLRQVLIDTGRR